MAVDPNHPSGDLQVFVRQHWLVLTIVLLGLILTFLMPGRMKLYYFTGLLSGSLAGLVPFFVARFYGQLRTAVLALVSCIIAGGFLGLFGTIPIALIFLVIISLRANRSDKATPASGA